MSRRASAEHRTRHANETRNGAIPRRVDPRRPVRPVRHHTVNPHKFRELVGITARPCINLHAGRLSCRHLKCCQCRAGAVAGSAHRRPTGAVNWQKTRTPLRSDGEKSRSVNARQTSWNGNASASCWAARPFRLRSLLPAMKIPAFDRASFFTPAEACSDLQLAGTAVRQPPGMRSWLKAKSRS